MQTSLLGVYGHQYYTPTSALTPITYLYLPPLSLMFVVDYGLNVDLE